MKAERISIFNYEAFYLDHLEGVLGEEDTALLLDFLESHPELIVQEDDFLTFDLKSDTAVFSEKDSLKITTDYEAITRSNVEHFLIAEAEGDLSDSKQVELNALILQYPHLEKERVALVAMFLKADESIVYADKASLKRKVAIVFWPYIALAAASVLIAFLFVMNQNSEPSRFVENVTSPPKVLPKENSQRENSKPQIAKDNVTQNDQIVSEGSNKIQDQHNPLNRPNDQTSNRKNLATVNSMDPRLVRRVINTIDMRELQPVASKIVPTVSTFTSEDERAQIASPEMKNPIKSITTRIEKTLNTPVDFQTGKAANNAGSGFFLKIGKLEISRNKGKN